MRSLNVYVNNYFIVGGVVHLPVPQHSSIYIEEVTFTVFILRK